MSDLEESAKNLLRRWSRRKREAETRGADDTEPRLREGTAIDASAASRASPQNEADLPPFDPAILPPIESITVASDIRAFLAPGVPEELTRAALRRVWISDPTIRDFVGIAENQWDFTCSDGVPGFGSLELTPELRRMVARLIDDAPGPITPQQHANAPHDEQIAEISGELPPPPTTQAPSEGDAKVERSEARIDRIRAEAAPAESVHVVPQDRNSDAALQKSTSGGAGSPRSAHRRHGGAVPT
jgi:hypothetical protein